MFNVTTEFFFTTYWAIRLNFFAYALEMNYKENVVSVSLSQNLSTFVKDTGQMDNSRFEDRKINVENDTAEICICRNFQKRNQSMPTKTNLLIDQQLPYLGLVIHLFSILMQQHIKSNNFITTESQHISAVNSHFNLNGSNILSCSFFTQFPCNYTGNKYIMHTIAQ